MGLTIVLFLFVFLFSVMFLRKNLRRPSNFPPGPKFLPLVGNLLLVKKLSKKYGGLHRAFHHLAEEYKTPILGLKMGSSFFVVFYTRKYLKLLFSEENFQGRPDNFFTRLRTMGERRGITINDGPDFHAQRKFAVQHLSQLGFTKGIVKDFIQQEVKDLLTYLQPGGDNICISTLLTPAVLNVIWAFVAGSKFSYDDPKLHSWLSCFNARGKAFDVSGGMLSKFPWMRFIAPEKSGYKLITQINHELKQFIENEISKHKLKKTTEVEDFIDAYLQHMKDANSNSTIFNEEQLAAVCLDFFIAGLHTTNDTLTFALIAMVKFPDIQTKVQECLDGVLNVGDTPNFQDRHKLPYIEAVLQESMRYTHVVPFLGPRRVLNDTIVDGYLIPQNATVLGDLDAYYRSPECWANPESFRPERFLNAKGDGLISPDKHFFFGRGARSCIGDMLARHFIFTFFTSILHRYQIRLAPSAGMPQLIPGITTKPEPFFISMKLREKYSNSIRT